MYFTTSGNHLNQFTSNSKKPITRLASNIF